MPLFDGAERHSITHHHFLAVLASEIRARGWLDRTVRILDVGCGSGQLIGCIAAGLPRLVDGISLELHGFDVSDSRVQADEYFAGTLAALERWHPAVAWSDRLHLIGSHDDWPYPDEYFDVVLSNQVMEHVRDHAHAFGELRRVLRTDGISPHLFPLHSSWMEWHLKIPFAHWIADGDVLERYIRAASRVGLGTWKRYCRTVEPVPIAEFARMNRDFLVFETNYLRERELARLLKEAGLRHSFRYTGDFYMNRLRLAFGRSPRYFLRASASVAHRLGMLAFKRISSICLVLEKQNSYKNRGFHTPENYRAAAG